MPSKLIKRVHDSGTKLIITLFDVSPTVAITTLVGTALVIIGAIFYFLHTAPPDHITLITGPEGGTFQKTALKYAKILETNGVTVKILTSEGSIENLKYLENPKEHIDVGFVQDGIQTTPNENLVSLGNISYQPVLLFYRSAHLELLSELKNKKISIGPEGSGTRIFALKLLELNGIKENEKSAELLGMEAQDASKALLDKKIDAAFIMSESASTDILHTLLRSKEVHLYNFKQASAYSRKIDSLNQLDLPEGAIDLGRDIPAHDLSLVGPTVALIAKKTLNPALSDLLLEAATQVHSHPGTYQKRGEFPNAIEHSIPISEDANRFYKSGKSFIYRYLPFWLASILSRVIVVFIPTFVVLIPILKSIPAFFRWRVQSKIRQRYRDLLEIEKNILAEQDPKKLEQLKKRFDQIEWAVNRMDIKAKFADQYYALRGHIDLVRNLVELPRKHSTQTSPLASTRVQPS